MPSNTGTPSYTGVKYPGRMTSMLYVENGLTVPGCWAMAFGGAASVITGVSPLRSVRSDATMPPPASGLSRITTVAFSRGMAPVAVVTRTSRRPSPLRSSDMVCGAAGGVFCYAVASRCGECCSSAESIPFVLLCSFVLSFMNNLRVSRRPAAGMNILSFMVCRRAETVTFRNAGTSLRAFRRQKYPRY